VKEELNSFWWLSGFGGGLHSQNASSLEYLHRRLVYMCSAILFLLDILQ